MAQIVDSFIDIAYEIKSSYGARIPVNTTNGELFQQIIENSTLLEALANRTGLSEEYITQTVSSIYYSAQQIQYIYDSLNSMDNGDGSNDTEQTNGTICGGRLDSTNLVIASFVPALIIIFILSFVNTRLWKRGCCRGRPGLAIPVNLLDSYEDRYTYACAFGATASRIVRVILDSDFAQVLGEDFRELQQSSPSYLTSLFRILAAIVVGVSYYPFFACISTHQRLLGAVLGTIFSSIWFLSYLFQLIDCADSSGNGFTIAENILLEATSILFHGLLLLLFIRVLIRCLISRRRGMVISKDEWKENYKYHYVKKLLKPVPKSNGVLVKVNGIKQKVVSNVYHWKPDFKYSTRIICIYITGCACLYLVVVNFVILGRYVKIIAEFLVEELKENDIKAKAGGKSDVDWDRILEGIKVTAVCWMVAIGIATIKDLVMVGNMVSWYRGHILRLQRGDRSFLPYNMDNQAPVNIMVASFKFAGYQAGYIIWSFMITHMALFLIVTALALGLFWPLTWGGFKDAVIPSMVLTLWPTLFITLITIILQRLMAKYLFLRDKGAMLALNNRRLFHIVSYFLFFLNIFVGLFSCLIRIFYAILLGALFLPRLQKSALPRDWELFDPGYKTYIGYLFLEHTHANPILFTFNRLMWESLDKERENESEITEIDIECVKEVRPRRAARIRWFLAVTLINNPSLQDLRKIEEETIVEKKGCFSKIKNLRVKVARKIDAMRDHSVESKL